jgi:hypothetical protein
LSGGDDVGGDATDQNGSDDGPWDNIDGSGGDDGNINCDGVKL